MKFIQRKTHGYLDYLVGVFLIAAPWLLGFSEGGSETLIPVILGAAAIFYSLFTDYELGAFHLFPFRFHLILDVASGILLALSPWLFNFSEHVYLPHLVLGLMEIVVVLATRTETSASHREKRTYTLTSH